MGARGRLLALRLANSTGFRASDAERNESRTIKAHFLPFDRFGLDNFCASGSAYEERCEKLGVQFTLILGAFQLSCCFLWIAVSKLRATFGCNESTQVLIQILTLKSYFDASDSHQRPIQVHGMKKSL